MSNSGAAGLRGTEEEVSKFDTSSSVPRNPAATLLLMMRPGLCHITHECNKS